MPLDKLACIVAQNMRSALACNMLVLNRILIGQRYQILSTYWFDDDSTLSACAVQQRMPAQKPASEQCAPTCIRCQLGMMPA